MSQSIAAYKVTYNTRKKPATRVKEVSFGGGYRQILVDQTDYDEEQWEVDFAPVTEAQALALETILLNSVNGTSNYILWTGPGESTAKYYTASGISKYKQGPNCWKLGCAFRREFPVV
jgi:phage-related protein